MIGDNRLSSGHVHQNGVQIVANSGLELISHIRTQRKALRSIIQELKPEYSTGLVADNFDGYWSITTENIVSKLDAQGVELNYNWASLPQNWKCPCCNREKKEIAYKNSSGILIAKVASHHDHFIDFINRSFVQSLGSRWNENGNVNHDVAERLYPTLVAFENVVICEACNQADGKAKQVIALSLANSDPESVSTVMEYFSFSVDEIRSFIKAKPNSLHQIDNDAALRVFAERCKLPTIKARMDIVNFYLKFLKDGVHWRSAEKHPSREDVDEAARDALDGLGLANIRNFDLMEHSCTTRTGYQATNNWRKITSRLSLPPEVRVQEFLTASAEWKALPAGWACPCCGRVPKKIVRYSNSRTLHARLDYLGIHPERVSICMDCKDVANGLAREAGVDNRLILLGEVRSLIVFRSHQRHKLKSDLATDQMVRLIRDRLREPDPDDVNESDENFTAI
ncbi:hypothetical protein [Nitrospirillum viridazoti]|uniref:hypothetical protein n=1 Tax=Nitrospirillum viridazoti TaxID=3144925 RepID=UPI0011AD6AFE|nr:hypothetical protein [Nitrospirillum amazonense]TWB39004.1 hypothetical protein FBZ91_106337 [Nitrospirillum amazonense]